MNNFPLPVLAVQPVNGCALRFYVIELSLLVLVSEFSHKVSSGWIFQSLNNIVCDFRFLQIRRANLKAKNVWLEVP